MNVLRISAFYRVSAAVLVRDSDIVAPAQEEHFISKKHYQESPRKTIISRVDLSERVPTVG